MKRWIELKNQYSNYAIGHYGSRSLYRNENKILFNEFSIKSLYIFWGFLLSPASSNLICSFWWKLFSKNTRKKLLILIISFKSIDSMISIWQIIDLRRKNWIDKTSRGDKERERERDFKVQSVRIKCSSFHREYQERKTIETGWMKKDDLVWE